MTIPADGGGLAARRSPATRWRAHRWSILTAAALLLPTLALFWEIVFAGRVLFWGVPLMQFGPWYQTALDAIRVGEWPLWNPLVGNGAPLMANYQVAVFYPPNWLHLLLPTASAMSWSMVLHILWAGLGMWCYARLVGFGRLARLVSALSFMLSGYLISRLGFVSIGSTLPWLPWLLWAGERVVRGEKRAGPVLGLCLGMQWLAGHAQTSFYSGLALGGYLLWRTLQRGPSGRPSWRQITARGGSALIALAAGFGLAAVQLLPTAELQSLSQRAAGVEEGFGMTYSLWPMRLIALVAPRFFGHPGTDNYWGYCCNYWEDNGYVGLLPLLLAAGAVYAWVRRRTVSDEEGDSIARTEPVVPYFATMSAAALVLALGVHTPIYPLLFRHVPFLGQFQAPARFLALWTAGVSVLAGVGVERWRPTRRAKRLAGYGIVVGLALLLATAGAGRFLTDKTTTFSHGLLQLGTGLVLIGLLGLWQPWPNQEPRRFGWSALALALVALDLLIAVWGANPTAEPWLYTRPTESSVQLRAAGSVGRTYYPPEDEYLVTWDRFLSFESFGPADTAYWFAMRETLLPNMGLLDRAPTVNNFDPLLSARYSDLMEAVEAADVQERVRLLEMMGVETLIAAQTRPDLSLVYANETVAFSRLPAPLPRAYVVFAAQRVDDRYQALQAVTRSAVDPKETVILEGARWLPDSSGAQAPLTPVSTLTSTFNSVTIRAALPAAGYLVLLDSYYPGWQALVDGNPTTIYPANAAFRAVALSAGDHTVEFTYRPASFSVGAWISAASGLLLLAWFSVGNRWKVLEMNR